MLGLKSQMLNLDLAYFNAKQSNKLPKKDTMSTISIKSVTLTELPQLQEIARQTFKETFAAQNTELDMQHYLHSGFSTNKLSVELNNRESEFYFARLDTSVIGYLKVNYGQAQTELKDKNSLEIERIYVLNSHQGKKVGQLLYEKALSSARSKNADFIWLGVWEKNLRAIKFCKKNGFVEFNKHVFILGKDEQTDLMMRLDLRPNT